MDISSHFHQGRNSPFILEKGEKYRNAKPISFFKYNLKNDNKFHPDPDVEFCVNTQHEEMSHPSYRGQLKYSGRMAVKFTVSFMAMILCLGRELWSSVGAVSTDQIKCSS